MKRSATPYGVHFYAKAYKMSLRVTSSHFDIWDDAEDDDILFEDYFGTRLIIDNEDRDHAYDADFDDAISFFDYFNDGPAASDWFAFMFPSFESEAAA